MRDVVLEVAARRYYRIRDLGDVRLLEIEGQQLAATEYRRDGHTFHLVVGFAEVDRLPSLLGAVGEHLVDVA